MSFERLILTIKLFRLPSVFAMNLFIFLPLAIATGKPAFSILLR